MPAMDFGGLMFKFTLFRSFSLPFAFWWVIIPNIGAIAMWPIGGPQAAFPIAVCGLLAIGFCHFESTWLKRIGIVICFLLAAMMYVAISFNLNAMTIFSSLQFLTELDLSKSPEYVLAIGVMILALGLAIAFGPRTPRLSTFDQKLVGLAFVGFFILVDGAATAGTRGSYKMSAPAGTPIDSAIGQNRLAPGSVSARNLIVILVESLGEPNNPHDRALFDAAWGAQRWSARYQVSRGTSAYFGSTTNAELRELCSVWADYESFDFDGSHCLPAQFRDAGFHTTAIHSFTSDFFERHAWYPKLGFQDRLFLPELLELDARRCGGVFAGACDPDIPALIGDRLRKSGNQRNLIYWLTLNSHLPVPEDYSLRTEDCRVSDPDWNRDFPMLCRSYMLQKRLADAIAQEVMKADFPEADILIVGDHMPPFFPRALRSRYDTGHVPWIMLRSKAALQRSRDRQS
ncbi:hypothetical protein NTCA1_04600 [Novosphingobium sp. TCA1]|nr:hypothetical protein NTCA1_04600 [Novosphingobium sp. TCA1]